MWTNIVGRLKIDAADFVAGHIDDILRDMKNSDTVTLVRTNVVSFLRGLQLGYINLCHILKTILIILTKFTVYYV